MAINFCQPSKQNGRKLQPAFISVKSHYNYRILNGQKKASHCSDKQANGRKLLLFQPLTALTLPLATPPLMTCSTIHLTDQPGSGTPCFRRTVSQCFLKDATPTNLEGSLQAETKYFEALGLPYFITLFRPVWVQLAMLWYSFLAMHCFFRNLHFDMVLMHHRVKLYWYLSFMNTIWELLLVQGQGRSLQLGKGLLWCALFRNQLLRIQVRGRTPAYLLKSRHRGQEDCSWSIGDFFLQPAGTVTCSWQVHHGCRVQVIQCNREAY